MKRMIFISLFCCFLFGCDSRDEYDAWLKYSGRKDISYEEFVILKDDHLLGNERNNVYVPIATPMAH